MSFRPDVIIMLVLRAYNTRHSGVAEAAAGIWLLSLPKVALASPRRAHNTPRRF